MQSIKSICLKKTMFKVKKSQTLTNITRAKKMTSQGSVVVKEEAVIQADLLKKMTEKPTMGNQANPHWERIVT